MLIKNKDLLSETPLRDRALKILNSGLEAIDTKKIIQKTIKLKNNYLFIRDRAYELSNYRNIYLVAFGKDSFVASSEIKNILGKRLLAGIVLSLKKDKIPGLETYQCTHPNTSSQNVEATTKVIELIKKTTEDDLVLVVISGGGSAMLTAPYKINYEQKAKITESLMNSGANIEELNIVRKHLSEIKGGRLAQLIYPSTLVTLIFSDVIGNDLSTIASGPTIKDHSTSLNANEVLNKYNIFEKVSLPNLQFSETPKEEKYFQKVENFLIMDNSVATAAMEEESRNLGYSTRVFANNIHGKAKDVGNNLLNEARKGEVLIAAGEATVEVTGNGIGGRSQELVLANLNNIKENQVIISAGSDGHDHSDYAGAIGDVYTLKKAKEKNIDPNEYLQNNDSFHFFQKVGDGIETGLLESNVADLMLVITENN